MKNILLFLLFITFPYFGAMQAQVIYVDADATGADNGQNWQDAYVDLQMAINNAVSGDTLWVAQGIYKPSENPTSSSDDRDKTFLLKDEVAIYGGFKGNETSIDDRESPEWNLSVLSGDIGISNDSSDNVYHVVLGINLSDKALLDGFTIIDGNADGGTDNTVDNETIQSAYGAGIYLVNSDIMMKNIQITENIARIGGAGINNYNGSPQLLNALVKANKITGDNIGANDDGGGAGMRNVTSASETTLIVPVIKNTTFDENEAIGVQGGGAMKNTRSQTVLEQVKFNKNSAVNVDDGGGAMYNIDSDGKMTSVLFYKNTSTGEGGAMYNDGSSPIILDSEFIDNSSEDEGGAIENDAQSNVELTKVLFKGNQAKGNGGAIQNWKSSPIIMNAVFDSNISEGNGGALSLYTESEARITNTTFTANEAEGNGGAIYISNDAKPVITNALFTYNEADQSGGAIYTGVHNNVTSSPIFTNITVTKNSAGVSGGGGYDEGTGGTQIRNSIITGNFAPTDEDVDAPISMLTSDVLHIIVDDAYFEGGSNPPVSLNYPIFKDVTADDYRLDDNSEAIDQGDSTLFNANETPDISNVVVDITGADRIMGANIDLGAYEYCTSSVTPSITITSMPNVSDSIELNTPVVFTSTIADGGLNPTYEWYKNNTLITGENGNTYTGVVGVDFDNEDKIYAQLKSSLSCANYQTVKSNEIKVVVKELGVDKFQSVTSNDLIVYPNPSDGKFYLNFQKSSQDYHIFIQDIQGRALYHNNIKENNTQQEIDLRGVLNSGVYLLTVYSNSGEKQVTRLIVR